MAKSYQDLSVWQRAIQLCVALYKLTSQFPKEELARSLISAIAAAMFLIIGVGQGSGQITRALLSVDNLNLPADHSIAGFRIETWGVSLLSVCHIPPSWNLSQEKYEDPAGLLIGRSDVHGEPLRELHQMFLVDVYSYQPLPKGDPKGEYHPASFSGWVEIIEEGSDMHGKRRPLRASNFHLKPASYCPMPPPAQP